MATPVGVGRALRTAPLGFTGIRTAPPVPPVRPQAEASALIVPAAADPVRRRGAGARPDGVFSGAPWHCPARPPGVISPHDGAVERQPEAMSHHERRRRPVARSHEYAVPTIREVVKFFGPRGNSTSAGPGAGCALCASTATCGATAPWGYRPLLTRSARRSASRRRACAASTPWMRSGP